MDKYDEYMLDIIEDDEELNCPRCGGSDLQNFGGCFICNECGLSDNINK